MKFFIANPLNKAADWSYSESRLYILHKSWVEGREKNQKENGEKKKIETNLMKILKVALLNKFFNLNGFDVSINFKQRDSFI